MPGLRDNLPGAVPFGRSALLPAGMLPPAAACSSRSSTRAPQSEVVRGCNTFARRFLPAFVVCLGVGCAVMAGNDDGRRLFAAWLEPPVSHPRRRMIEGVVALCARDAATVVIERVQTGCSCVTAQLPPDTELPETLAAGEKLRLTVTLDPRHLSGPVRKLVLIRYRCAGAVGSELLTVPVTATAVAGGMVAREDAVAGIAAGRRSRHPSRSGSLSATGEAASGATAGSGIPRWDVGAPGVTSAWSPATPEAQWREALVVFLSANCSDCNRVRREWLPRLRASGFGGTVYLVGVDDDDGVALLDRLTAECGVTAPVTAPAVWRRGVLTVGAAAIGRLDSGPLGSHGPLTEASGR